jgi:hypothetical protein
MNSSRGKSIAFVLFALLISAFLLAGDIPLTNWTVPPYHRSGITTMTDISVGIGFVAIQPCRVVDTRPASAFPAGYGPPIMAANAIRTFGINSSTQCPGIPSAAQAYSLNFTVTETTGGGDVRAWPTGNPPPTPTSVQNWAAAGVTLANATIIPAGTSGNIDVQVAGSATHLIIDINGYFTSAYNAGNPFVASGDVGSFVFFGITFPGAMGQFSNSSTTFSYGVRGLSSSTTNGGAGVFGSANGGDVFSASATCAECIASGVRGGSANGHGVLGTSRAPGTAGGVTGIFFDSSTNNEFVNSVGILGFSSTTGVRANNNISKGGTVSFTEPHATDASKKIVYVALEGNEAGTYFRGRGKFQNGTATIDLPDDFRMVTQPDGLSIQVTPIGEMATVAVSQIGLERIVVKGSRNVEFFYTVNGVRRGYGDFQPIVANDKDYMPVSADARMPDYRPEIRSRLIANGTYKPDGTVNMETVQRLGWDRIWEERSRPQPQPTQPSP